LATDDGVTALGTGSLVSFSAGALSGYAELAADRYYVEIGSGVDAGKFRLVDSAGSAVAIATSSGGTTAGTDWIAIADGTYNTGRGLTITFQGNGSYAPATLTNGAANAYYDVTHTVQSPRSASLTVNGLSISRGRNVGLNDVVEDLTFDLKGTGNAQVTVGQNSDAVVKNVKTLLGKVNDLMSYIKSKTEPQVDQAASTAEKTVYKQGPLTDDWTFRSLRRNLANDLLSNYSGAATPFEYSAGALSRLADVGLRLADDGLSFELSNESALRSALSSDFQAVADLFGHVMDRVESRVAPYLDGSSAIIATSQDSIDKQVGQVQYRIQGTEARLRVKEEALRKQFQGLQAQLVDWQYQYQSMQSFLLGSLYDSQS
jgi:flagellar capping protein FliD